ncbi:MAG: hypothetical protein R3C45_12345 [Phycisphaerales bacterium]
MFILVVIGIIGLIVLVIVLSIRHEKKRTEALRTFAQANGFSFEDIADSPEVIGLPAIELFNRGHSKRTSNTMRGEIASAAVRVLDYRYTVGSGKNSSTSHQTLVAVSTGDAMLPSFTLAPETFFHKIGQAFGYQDIDIDQFPEFSKRYLLRGGDEAAIRTLFGGRVVDAYMNGLVCNVEVRDGWLFVFKAGKRLKPEEIQPRIESAFAFLFELTGA